MSPQAELRLFAYRYFPYELELAAREVQALAGAPPARANGSFLAPGLEPAAARRLTYFQEFIGPEGTRVVPLQALLEASDRDGRTSRATSRQHTRYSAHGIHEYRGKFNPQIVRSVCNLLGVGEGGRLWDPFCGSGTVLLEALHGGLSALGTERNPLGVLIANAKLAAVSAPPEGLLESGRRFVDELTSRGAGLEDDVVGEARIRRTLSRGWEARLHSRDYLAKWFPRPVLAQLQLALDVIAAAVPRPLRALFRVLVSEVVRDVSWQDPGDLRIRRRKDAARNYAALTHIARHATEQLRRIAAARAHLGSPSGWRRAVGGDALDLASLPGAARRYLEAGVDLVLTSPPYATALPYIDTQRLSLALLGLSTPQRIRGLEFELLGSREIAKREREEAERRIRRNPDGLPARVIGLSRALLSAVDRERDGFRRINTPSLVYRYFAGMKRAAENMAAVLRPGGAAVLLVGPNRTVLGGRDHTIDTPAMLAAIGEAVGLELTDRIPLQAYQRYSLHSRNSIREESLVILRKPPRRPFYAAPAVRLPASSSARRRRLARPAYSS